MDWIMHHEPGERNYYSGYLGPVTSAQDFDLFVNLRCMQVSGNTAILYAGAGITALSNPTAEWLETERKMQIIKSVL
jgi:isochorismate synthase